MQKNSKCDKKVSLITSVKCWKLNLDWSSALSFFFFFFKTKGEKSEPVANGKDKKEEGEEKKDEEPGAEVKG